MKMRIQLRLHFLSRRDHYNPHRRGFATKYSGRVVVETDNGRSFAVEVENPILQADVRGYPLPRRDLICKVVNILQSPPSTSAASSSPDLFVDLSDYLETLNVMITPSEASEILKSLKSPNLALKFFQFCSSEIPNFRHNSFTFNRILLILSKAYLPNRLDLVRNILNEMDQSGIRGNISTVNLLIGIFSDREEDGEIDELENCLRLTRLTGFSRT